MLQSPADEGGDMGHEGLTAGGEAVLNSRFGINLPADKPYLFKPFERLREHLLGTIGHITVYYTHWTPAEAHVSPLQVGSVAAVEAELAEAKEALASGCKYFIGGHGGLAEKKQVEFKIAYLETVQRLLAENADAEGFLAALNAAYPELPGDAAALANALYAAK